MLHTLFGKARVDFFFTVGSTEPPVGQGNTLPRQLCGPQDAVLRDQRVVRNARPPEPCPTGHQHSRI